MSRRRPPPSPSRANLRTGAYRLDIRYSGKINTQANGLFALDYKNKEGKDARSLFTQFEAADARRFVPSWDEPDYKATWDLTARVPANEMAVSNMPAASSKPVARRPQGSTLPDHSHHVVLPAVLRAAATSIASRRRSAIREVGIVVSRGNGEKAQFALDAEAQILPYYDDYFGTPYPLPKLDNVAGPGQSQFFGAMENWGAIFTFERILLNDPAITSEGERQAIFGVEAHEMAHQWFGDLVTMAWWDDLWLNEGFASWMASKATRSISIRNGTPTSTRRRARSRRWVSTRSNRPIPIVQQIRTVEQTNQAFDTITYEKGESVIAHARGLRRCRCVARRASATTWRSTRIRTRAPSDLWAAMERGRSEGPCDDRHATSRRSRASR